MRKFHTYLYSTLLCVIFGMLAGMTCMGQTTAPDASESSAITSDSVTDKQRKPGEVEIAFLTCSPGREVHRMYGHTAIRILSDEEDWAVNFGWFSFNTPGFVMKFILGLTDYSAAWQTMPLFVYDFARDGMGVTEQRLNLTPTEALRVREAMMEILVSEGYDEYEVPLKGMDGQVFMQQVIAAKWTYRYNFLYDNCTTRAVDAIREALREEGEAIVFPGLDESTQEITQREMIHEFTTQSPWYELGQDLMLGPEVDCPHTIAEMVGNWSVCNMGNENIPITRNFLPIYAQQFFEKAQIRSINGQLRPLVTSTTDLSPFLHREPNRPAFPLSPMMVAGILLAATCLFSFGERKSWTAVADRSRQRAWSIWANAFDITLLVILGGVGCILTILTVWSEHPAVDINWLTFLFCPAYLLAIVMRFCSKSGDLMANATIICAVILTIFFGLTDWQQIPGAIMLFAVSVGIRAVVAIGRALRTWEEMPRIWGAVIFIAVYIFLQSLSYYSVFAAVLS